MRKRADQMKLLSIKDSTPHSSTKTAVISADGTFSDRVTFKGRQTSMGYLNHHHDTWLSSPPLGAPTASIHLLTQAAEDRNRVELFQTSLGRRPSDTELPSLGAVVGAAPDKMPHSRYISIRKCAKSCDR